MSIIKLTGLLLFTALYSISVYSETWISDLGDGTYQNPIIYADYSDPDVIRVGTDFYMTASSFNCVPALPVLHSKDLVNWKIINYAIRHFDDPDFDKPQHGNGVWAPAIRFHDGIYYIYYGDPDRGIFMVKTGDPYGRWESPVLVKKAHGNIDPCPLWDDDGRVYLIHAFAHSRAGVKSILQVNELNPDGTKIIDKGIIVFDGHSDFPTIEGPKFYKRNGYYYIFAPAGGVKYGWQTVLRSKSVLGPYEDKIVLAQGNTNINGPHQGGYIELENGDGWFVHFQDREAYGRIVHLQPVVWQSDWPVMGKDKDHDGIGEPVGIHPKPRIGKSFAVRGLQTSDEFDHDIIGLQWQWHANFKQNWYSLTNHKGSLRLYAQYRVHDATFWTFPGLLLQKFPAPQFIVTTRLDLHSEHTGEKSGLIVMGHDYSYVALVRAKEGLFLEQVTCLQAEEGGEEQIIEQIVLNQESIDFKVQIDNDAHCTFLYSLDGQNYSPVGKPFKAMPGKWIGAKVGLFMTKPMADQKSGYADFQFFRIE